MINTDALAENFWAHSDPAFHHEPDIELQKEIIKAQVCTYIEHKLTELIESLEDDELEIAKDNMNTLADTFAEIIDNAR